MKELVLVLLLFALVIGLPMWLYSVLYSKNPKK